MHEPDNIYDKIQEILGNVHGSLSVLEQQIDADVQSEYFNCSNNFRSEFDPEEVLKKKDTIFRKDITTEAKKILLIQLANIDRIEAYKTLEKYTNGTNEHLRDWALLALQECRLLMKTRLLEKSQILISTGLGGKGLKLRYFTVFIQKNLKSYTAFEKKVLKNETTFHIKQAKGEIESIHFDKEICTLLSIIPLQTPIQDFFDRIINECNQYGDFVSARYIITNVKIISNYLIRKMIRLNRE